jgi:N-acetylglucosamine-6-phosphate deacetylase
MPKAYTNATIFNGEQFLENHAVLVHDGIIEAIIAANMLPNNVQIIDCNNQLLVPAFLDLQVYGAGGQLFSAYPTTTALQLLAKHNASTGTTGCLATIATQPMPVIMACITAIKNYWQQGGQGILGMHLEGPYINETKRGAHVKEWVTSPTVTDIDTLLNHANGVIKMITIAPECVDEGVIELLKNANIKIAIGHSNANFEQATHYLNNGVSTITHLYNAMSPLHHREPGIVGAAMQHPSATASIIPDGIHVHYEAVKIAKQQMGERLYFITDAVTPTSNEPYQHVLNNDHYTLPNGILSGSALTMLKVVKNAVDFCHIKLEEALRMASLYPARVMGLQQQFGRIAPGFKAHFALLSANLENAELV